MADRGADLARAYYGQVVRPLVEKRWPGLPHAAARLGGGSDVLGYDDEVSRDHDWGLRLNLLVEPSLVVPVDEHLARELPETFAGHPTRFATTWDPSARHGVAVNSVEEFARGRLGFAASEPPSLDEWLSLTGQAALEVTAGPVFADSDGRLTAVRGRLRWLPDDVWRYAVATDWVRVRDELPFVARTGASGDDLGSRLVTARLVRVLAHLGYLLERRWPPYAKWFGRGFTELSHAGRAHEQLLRALAGSGWAVREDALGAAAGILLAVQRDVGLPVVDTAVVPFFERGSRGIGLVPEAVAGGIVDDAVRALPVGVGTVEQWVDDVAVLMDPARRIRAARSMLDG